MTATTLSAGVAATDASISVTSAADFPEPPFRVAVNHEEMVVYQVSGTTFSVARDQTTSLEQLVFDTFDREESDGWLEVGDGSGARWRGSLSDADSNQLVTGGVGVLQILTNAVGKTTLMEVPNLPLDEQARFKFVLVDQLDVDVDSYSRFTDSNNTYRARLNVSGAGAMSLRLAKIVASVTTNLAAAVVPPGTVAIGDEVNLAFQVTTLAGITSLSAKAWRTVDGEPAAWQTTIPDAEAALQVLALMAVRYRPVLASTFTIDDWLVSRVPTGLAHSSTDPVVLVDPWPFPPGLAVGLGPPASNPPTTSKYLDISVTPPVEYTRVGAVWYSVTLT